LLNEKSDINIQSEIDFTAGQVFNVGLNKEITLTRLKNSLKKDEKIILMAIGWLASQEKIIFLSDNNDIKIKVKD
ncbi:MAG: winged helix-turn-helix domain-containing protein, partial [Nanoarchaeota archaeon]|nr:winged helix-turn-helix domain-containing protein [Nanoarchaeota archaeon]